MRKTKIRLEVFRAPGGAVTVTTDVCDGGTRLCGLKSVSMGSKIAEFWLDRDAVEALTEDFAEVERHALARLRGEEEA